MEIKENISLKPFNTFGITVNATQFVEVNQINQLKEILQQNKLPLLILGGGSNVLFTKDFNGLVLKNKLKGIQLIDENEQEVIVKVAAGEVWHEFVLYCIEKGYAGIENLSLIPGSVGASPIQNIGAYGVEVKDVITEVEALNLKDYSIQSFPNVACEFDYRSSIFKTSRKGIYFITSVTFKLAKKATINTSYGAIMDELKKMNILHPTIKDVSNAVIKIRTSKLPDPQKIGNCGSFFKNPTVSEKVKNKILEKYPDAPDYPQANGNYKIAAGWLIEKCGWKGKRIDNYGVHKNQALVLVNYGGASGSDIFNLSEDIIHSVYQTFGIKLEREVNII
ncbi:MAG: UDP-N-acetylenolpyruvoylglucosamine reductase [Bacteroidetes bacterium RIFCSPLOWO2_12_FULL_31_6]|nr:MAG: UDP-N-acetylenolpyruvoylglucosamine reductase [Bacteroidetes bacterium RIFCSPLOWO2_12_FULL_31_6]